jgi:superfamily II DNA/RNA helicase
LKEIRCKVIYGGAESIEDHKRELKVEMPTVVVGTPGRVLDLVKKDILKLDKL